MNPFCPEKYLGEIFWDVEADQSEDQSAFVQYKENPGIELHGSNSENVNKRSIEFTRRSWPVEKSREAEFEKERSFRHMMNERMRRKRQTQCCLDLHSLLPHGTKSGTGSIIQTATEEIQRLQEHRAVLLKRNDEVEATSLKTVRSNEAAVAGDIIQLRVLNPTFGFDSIIGTLKCLKDLGIEARNIKSSFSSENLFGVLDIETMTAADAEKVGVVKSTVQQVERKLQSNEQRAPNFQVQQANALYIPGLEIS